MHFARLQQLYKSKKYPILAVKAGMLLELHENVGEGDTKRIQKFKGLVIQVKKPSHPDGTFTIRGTVAGVVVEKIFPLSFPKFDKVILLDQFAIRRARINYIRDKIGKDAKMKSIITVDIKGKDLLEEAMAKVANDTEELTDNTDSNNTSKVSDGADATTDKTQTPDDTATETPAKDEKKEEKAEAMPTGRQAPQDDKTPEASDNKEVDTKEDKKSDEDTQEAKTDEEKTDKA